jgi:hypothetical protein
MLSVPEKTFEPKEYEISNSGKIKELIASPLSHIFE